ncbi:hypothetical protein SAMN05192549_10333 [Duganella sacchari]|uniref:His Kinase A (Phospho-acceptor) domain-containing protein n=1 Tax=Duganella sacchari TaxID=551987 RepID=A0A1M7M5X4_9BURK|nr:MULTISPECIES: hypothetical protein [Duganella]MYM29156.1 hypothetical protein [Duganella sp. CY15W]SHM86023.1 hypothetical protein SAMN05192549_10333 [Duganella sacchari]
MSRKDLDAVRVRARLLAALNHDLRAPLARIATSASTGWVDVLTLENEARRQLEWLSDLQECARFELQAPELAPAPAYLHALMRHVSHDNSELPALAVLDARRLAQVLARLRDHAGGQMALRALNFPGDVALAFQAGVADGPWSDVTAALSDDRILPGVMVAAHLVRAMGGVLQQSGDALRFAIRVPLAEEQDAMPPTPHFDWPEPFGSGHAILLLEPHQPMQDYLSEILESAEFDVQYEPGDRDPSLILCADESVWDIWPREEAPPVLLHTLLPPLRPTDFIEVMYKPAPAAMLLSALRRRLEIRL